MEKAETERQVSINNSFLICPANILLACEMLKLPVFSHIASTVYVVAVVNPGCKSS